LNLGSNQDEVPILASFAPQASDGPVLPLQKAAVTNRTGSGALDAYYSSEAFRWHFSYYESHNRGSNLGVGGLTLAEAGLRSNLSSREGRATVNKNWQRWLYRGGFVMTRTDSNG